MERRSVYDFEMKGVVSIWLACVPLNQLPEDYFQEHYGDDDGPFTRFSEDFGFGFFDHDFVDTNSTAKRAKSIERLLGECSFSASYLKESVAAANRQGLDKTEFVFLLHDIDYRPAVTGISRSQYMAFLGSFRYDPEGASAFPVEQ